MLRIPGQHRVALILLCAALSVVLAPGRAAAADPEPSTTSPLFDIRVEPVAGGAELLTVMGRADAGLSDHPDGADVIPLVSVLRDTLGDASRENDRLRYVWVHGYARPSTRQRVTSAIPFLHQRMGNRSPSAFGPSTLPPHVLDLAAPDRDVWANVMWMAAQYALFDPYGALAKTSVRTFRRNQQDYRHAHIIRGLAVLSLYEADTGAEPVLSAVEMRDIQARLSLTQRTFGGVIDDAYLQRVWERETTTQLDLRGHNWELLRQRVEAEGLYFEPLAMPDGSALHALVWVAREDLRERGPRFDGRFLNIRSPWGDPQLLEWTGYTETRYFDELDQPVSPGAPGARAVELIPLALYGLDHPKIPAILVDFRDRWNPKRREVSRRVLHDITRNILSLSPYGDVHYFLGRTLYEFVTGRRGMDINQPSRLRSYAQLKLMLSLSSSLDPELAEETGRLVELVSMNPLQNDTAIETELAFRSYDALAAAAREPGGVIAARLDRDRRGEFRRLEHGRTARVLLRAATVLSAGIYRHREDAPVPDQVMRIDTARRLAYHTRFLEEVVASTPVIEVVWNIADVHESLRFLARHGAPGRKRTVAVAERVFAQTQDFQARRLSLDTLARLDTDVARSALARLAFAPGVDPELRALGEQYLREPSPPAERLAVSDAILASVGDE